MQRTRQRSAPPKPSAGAVEALGPYARTRLTVRAPGVALPLDVPADVFATRAIDEGTLLLLRNLPPARPEPLPARGGGTGAPGLPAPPRFPEARAVLVARDLLAG